MPSLLKMMAEMGLNITPFQRGLDQAKSMAAREGNNIGQAFSGVINRYFGVGAMVAFGASMVRRIAEIKDLADQFNLTTDEVQKFGAAFENSGLQAQDAGSAIDRLNRARKEAVESSQDLRDAFAAFGISVDQLNDAGLQTKDIFRQIGIAIREGTVGDRERAALMELMGKSGARFVGAMKSLENVQTKIIDEEQIKEVEAATRHLREIRKELEAIVVITGSKALKGDILGALMEQLKALGGGVELIKAAKKVREAMAGGELAGRQPFPQMGQEQLPPRDFAAIKELPEEVEALRNNERKKLFEDGIAAKQKLATGKAQAEVEKKMSEIVFGKLNRDEQIRELRRQQAEIEGEISHQKRQQVNDLYTEEVRQQNIADLKKQQLEAEEKIQALRRSGAIGFEGFRKIAQSSGLNPATYAAAESIGNDTAGMEKGIGQAVSILKDIDKKLGEKKVVLGR